MERFDKDVDVLEYVYIDVKKLLKFPKKVCISCRL